VIQNYVQLNSILDSEVAVMIMTVCVMVIIFAMGFCLGRYMRIRKIEDKWDKELVETQKVINEILKKAGIPKEISLKREDKK